MAPEQGPPKQPAPQWASSDAHHLAMHEAQGCRSEGARAELEGRPQQPPEIMLEER